MESHPSPDAAAAALAAVGAARSDLADRLVTPRWYHPLLGGAVALLIASSATRLPLVIGLAAALYVVSLYALPRAYRRATGVWVDGTTPRRARRWAVALGVTAAAGLLLGTGLARTRLWPLTLVCAVAVYVLTQVLGRRFDEELRAELREDPGAAGRLEPWAADR